MIGNINRITTKKYVYSVDDFKEFFKSVHGLNVTETKVSAGYGLEEQSYIIGTGIVRIYRVSDRFFGYYSDGYLYELNDQEKIQLFQIGGVAPCVTKILHGGKNKILFVGEKACLVDQSATSVTWCSASVITEHKGRIFSASERIITFSNPFDFSTASTRISIAGNIEIDEKSGNVLGFLSDNDKLYVVCSSAVHLINVENDFIDFKLKRLYCFSPSITENTIAEYLNGLVCLRDKAVYTFSDGKFNLVSSFMQNSEFSITGKATADDDHYYIPISMDGTTQKTAYVINLSTHAEGTFYLSTTILEKGYALNLGKICKISDVKNTTHRKTITSKQFAFNLPYKKTLCGISVETGNTCVLSVTGEFGVKKFSLKKGYNKFITNLSSTQFQVSFTLVGDEFYLQNLQLIYSKRGE